ncbi:MAG: STAS domain-containing protein [Bryobacterales bacterium]|nr:STAS domain-containing protein [Bryobacterales bacterium]
MRIENTTLHASLVVKVMDPRLVSDKTESFREQMRRFVEDGNRSIVLDLSQVDYVDSAGLGAILFVQNHVEKQGRFALAGTGERVMALLKLSRLDKLFRLYPTAEEAAAALAAG